MATHEGTVTLTAAAAVLAMQQQQKAASGPHSDIALTYNATVFVSGNMSN